MNLKISNLLWAKIAFVSCFVACIADYFSVPVFASFYPSYDPVSQPSSVLGAAGSPIARFVSVSWIVIGLVFVLFALGYGLSNLKNLKAHKIAAWLIGIYGIGEEMGSGILPGNHINGHITTMGWFHDAVGGIGMAALMILPLVLMKKFTKSAYPFMHRLCLLINITGFIIFLGFSYSHIARFSGHRIAMWHGLFQRLWDLNYYLFLMAIATQLLVENRKLQRNNTLVNFNSINQVC